MITEGTYEVKKDIVLKDGTELFHKGDKIYMTHGMFYVDMGVLPQEYQAWLKDFFIEEDKIGWPYIGKITTKEWCSPLK